jgi:hypothetical protein
VTGVTAAACAELAQLTPMLAPALRRDTTGSGRRGGLEGSLSLFNADVFAAGFTLSRQVPAVTMRASELVAEPWPASGRSFGACLIALPRFASRMTVLGLAVPVRQLDNITRSWVRMVKAALGLRTPDLALGAICPECLLSDPPHGLLYMAGSEAFINTSPTGPPLTWVTSGRVYCRQCDAGWAESEWGLLERMIRASGQHAQGPTSLPEHAPDVAC